jgi:hypothetical protein
MGGPSNGRDGAVGGMTALLDDLLARWVAEAAERGDRDAVAALSDVDVPDDFEAAIEDLHNEPEEPISSPWRRSA